MIKAEYTIDEYLAFGQNCPKKDGWLDEEKSCSENCMQAEENGGDCIGWGQTIYPKERTNDIKRRI